MVKSGGRDGPSQVGVAAAMRARDVSRPTETEIAELETAEPVTAEPEPLLEAYRAASSGRGGSTPDAS
jgi:hypothetical protein